MERYVKENAEDWTKVGARVRQVDSTNDSLREQAKAFAKAGHVLPEGYSLMADFQTAGKGRLGRVWKARPGENLLVSYLLSSAGLRPDQLFFFLQNCALAVLDTVESFVKSKEVKVKWPNDVLVAERKVAGILIESILMADEVSCIIVGIGINVNQQYFHEGIKATCLAQCVGEELDLEEVFLTLTRKLQSAQVNLRSMIALGDLHGLHQRYHENLFGFGELLVFYDFKANQEVTGRLVSVLPSGQLKLDCDGIEHLYTLDDIRFLRKFDDNSHFGS